MSYYKARAMPTFDFSVRMPENTENSNFCKLERVNECKSIYVILTYTNVGLETDYALNLEFQSFVSD